MNIVLKFKRRVEKAIKSLYNQNGRTKDNIHDGSAMFWGRCGAYCIRNKNVLLAKTHLL